MSARKIEDLASTADQTRAQVGARLSELRERTQPAVLADEAIDYAATQGKALASRAKTAAAAHPLAIGAGVAAIGLALLARHQLSRAKLDLDDQNGDYTDYDDSFSSSTAMQDAEEEAAPQNALVSVLIGLAAGALLGALSPQKD